MNGFYYSTYSFVGRNKLNKEAEQVLGKNWEAEDDASQIQEICDYIQKDRYVVSVLPQENLDNDIQVRERDDYDPLENLTLEQKCIDFLRDRGYYVAKQKS